MNWAYLHLLVNHLPVLGTVFGLALLVAALWRRSGELLVASLVVFILCGALGAVAFWTGEHAEDRVEGLPGVTEDVIHEHEEAAEWARIAVLALAAAALFALLYRRAARLRWAQGIVLLLALLATVLLARTADLGGQVRHTEIRGGLTSP
jgi:protein-S-isoprenylcysteine O-methyltransferase Ste14